MRIMQGDSYPIKITITDTQDQEIEQEDIDDVELTIGDNFYRTISNGKLYWSSGSLYTNLTQQEAFEFNSSNECGQVRVKFTNGIVVGVNIDVTNIVKSISKEIL